MEDMEVDSQFDIVTATRAHYGLLSDSDNSIELEDESDDDLPPFVAWPAWATLGPEQWGVGRISATQRPRRARARRGPRVHYPSQNAPPSGGFLDFLLRVPAASEEHQESGSSTEISQSESDTEEVVPAIGPSAAPALVPSPRTPLVPAALEPTDPTDSNSMRTDPADLPVQSVPDATPSVPGATPLVPGATPLVPGATPLVPDATPSVPDATPSVPDATPSVPDATPSVPGATPSVPGATPSVPGATPSVPGATPLVPDATPLVPGATPLVSGATPSVPGATPSVPGATPLVPDDTPSVPGVTPGIISEPVVQAIPMEEGGEGEGDTCVICFEPWTSAGAHHLAALRCGHLFGHNCIERWLKERGQSRCPQCNKKAKKSDIVRLYARKLQALDNTEHEGMKKSLLLEQSKRQKAELECAQSKMQLQVVTEEYGKIRQQMQELKNLVGKAGLTPSFSAPGLSQRGAECSRPGQYTFSKAVLVSQPGGCRVLSYCETLGCLLASQPSPQSTLIPGFGVKKVSAVTMKACQYIPIHSKQIRGLSFNTQNDSLMLSASLDNTIKLTSLETNTVVQTYNTGKPVWSCCWSLDNSNYVYAGLSNGSVLIYDTRDTSTHVQELQPLRSKCPVASLCYVPCVASSSFPCGGVIAGSLEGGCFWEQVDNIYRPHPLPLESAGCTDIQVERNSRHCLVTYRPGRSNPSLRCVLMELTREGQLDSHQNPVCSCSPVQSFSAGSSCKLLTKNAVFPSPTGGRMLVCAGDEASNSTMVWDAGSGALLHKLPADLPVLDICPLEVNRDHYLASLTEKMLKIYKWE